MKINSFKASIFVTYIFIIIYISIYPVIIFQSQWRYDKFIHFFEYFLLGYLLVNALEIKTFKENKIKTFIFLICFACFDEGVQNYIPKRISSFADIFADISGSFFGSYLRYAIYKIKEQTKND